MDGIKTLFHYYGKEKTIELCLAATERLRKAIRTPAGNDIVLSPKAQRLKEKCISFGPTGPMFASLISIIIEEDIELATSKTFPFIRFACVVPIASNNVHNYPLHAPFFLTFFTGNSTAPEYVKGIRLDGSFGNAFRPLKGIIQIPADDVIVAAVLKLFATVDQVDQRILW